MLHRLPKHVLESSVFALHKHMLKHLCNIYFIAKNPKNQIISKKKILKKTLIFKLKPRLKLNRSPHIQNFYAKR